MDAPAKDSVLAAYLADVATRNFDDDPGQRLVAQELDRILDGLRAPAPRRLWPWAKVRRAPVRGAYIYGDVGRGKTYLMDLFYELVPGRRKMRQHFHRFMQRVHERLHALRGRREPLEIIARKIAANYDLICFDEFFVADIADAMLLGKLFTTLFEQGVTLVATSNVHPDDLYKDGLQRSRFVPAIAQINTHTNVIEANGGADYRLRLLRQGDIYTTPLGAKADAHLAHYFAGIAPGHKQEAGHISIQGRKIPFRRRADSIAWFDFDALCRGPRGVSDYIELARCFGTIIVSDIPVLDAQLENEARRFIALVDEFYDRRVKLIVSADAPLATLYQGNKLQFEFARTRSRLQEMQSGDYLAMPHRP